MADLVRGAKARLNPLHPANLEEDIIASAGLDAPGREAFLDKLKHMALAFLTVSFIRDAKQFAKLAPLQATDDKRFIWDNARRATVNDFYTLWPRAELLKARRDIIIDVPSNAKPVKQAKPAS